MIPYIIHLSSYWIFCGLFYYYDRKFILKSFENRHKYIDAMKISLLNQLIFTMLIYYLLNNKINILMITSEYDSIEIILSKLFIIYNLSNLLFYISHRLLHHEKIFKYIHYKHHQFITPVAPSSLYAHPIEHIICNNLCFLVPTY